MDDAKHGPELTGSRSFQLRLYRIEGGLQGGAETNAGLGEVVVNCEVVTMA